MLAAYISCKKAMRSLVFYGALALLALLCRPLAAPAQIGWPNYGKDAGGTRHSAAKQIDRSHVAQLKAAWTYRKLGRSTWVDRWASSTS